MWNKLPMFETCTEEVIAISEDNGNNKKGDKTKKVLPQNLTPVNHGGRHHFLS
jgi:hypothetical protein